MTHTDLLDVLREICPVSGMRKTVPCLPSLFWPKFLTSVYGDDTIWYLINFILGSQRVIRWFLKYLCSDSQFSSVQARAAMSSESWSQIRMQAQDCLTAWWEFSSSFRLAGAECSKDHGAPSGPDIRPCSEHWIYLIFIPSFHSPPWLKHQSP